MARKKNSVIAAAARMREAKVTRNQTKPNVEDSGSASDTEPDVDMCCWDGSVNHVPSSDEEPMGFDTDAEEFSDLDGEELVASIEEEMKRKECHFRLRLLCSPLGTLRSGAVLRGTVHLDTMGIRNGRNNATRRRLEKRRRRRCNTQRRRQVTHSNAIQKTQCQPHALVFWQATHHMMTPATHSLPTDNSAEDVHSNGGIFCGYLSDNEPDDLTDDECDTPEVHRIMTVDASAQENLPTSSSWDFQVAAPPPLKRRKLDVPFRVARLEAHGERRKKVLSALKDIEKVLKSKKTEFHAGNSVWKPCVCEQFEATCTWWFTRKGENGCGKSCIRVSWFSGGWEAGWFACGQRIGLKIGHDHLTTWLPSQILLIVVGPCNLHRTSLICPTNKWAMDPAKLVAFSKNKLLPDAAEKYVHHIVDQEMPRGLKKYIDAELLPRLHLKVGKGISNEFLPRMAEYRRRLVEFTVGEVQKEVNKAPDNFVETQLVMLAHDEMTAQSNNSKGASWVYDQEQPLKKKGVGRGLHQSDVICSTYGWLPEASQTLEYGKNYDGYWNGELFVKQKMIFPSDHPDYPDQPKGIKQVLLERGLWPNKGLVMQCKSTCEVGVTDCCARRLLGNQPDFKEQRSLVQEVIEAAGHDQALLGDHCDYTFDTLKENMPKALAAVEVSTIRKWEHRMQRWMDGYREGLGAKEAQFKVREFSSTKYTSHRRIPNQVAAVFDT
ncbi:transposase domain-containing protein [Salix suchowensis]|nr:transposase domain-containing protein [Salix suchowensis]